MAGDPRLTSPLGEVAAGERVGVENSLLFVGVFFVT